MVSSSAKTSPSSSTSAPWGQATMFLLKPLSFSRLSCFCQGGTRGRCGGAVYLKASATISGREMQRKVSMPYRIVASNGMCLSVSFSLTSTSVTTWKAPC